MNSAVQNTYAQSTVGYAVGPGTGPNSTSTHLEELHSHMRLSKDDLTQILSRMQSFRTRLFGQTPDKQVKGPTPTSVPNGAIDAMSQESADMRGLIGEIYVTLNDLEKLV